MEGTLGFCQRLLHRFVTNKIWKNPGKMIYFMVFSSTSMSLFTHDFSETGVYRDIISMDWHKGKTREV